MSDHVHNTLNSSLAALFDECKKDPHTYDVRLACPICRSEFVHIHSVSVLQDRYLVSVQRMRVLQAENSSEQSGRGSIIRIAFLCEEGCVFTMEFKFHKGATILRFPPEGAAPSDGGGYPECNELWRD